MHSKSRFTALCAGLGAGKSKAGTMRLILLMISDPGANGAYFMPTFDLLRLRAIPGVQEDLEEIGLDYTLNKSTSIIEIHGYGFIVFRSYDNPERIVSFEIAHSIIDELDTLPKNKAELVWRKVSERNRQKRDGQNTISMVSTPDNGINGFFYEKWVKKQQDGYRLIKASTLSNPFLPPDYVQQIRDNYDPILADLYINGEFVSLTQSKIYHFYNRQKHHTDRTIQNTDKYLYVGIDFNIGGCCSAVAVIESGLPVIVDEFASHDTHDFINNLAARYKGVKIIVYPDASGGSRSTNATSSDIALIEAAGHYCDYDKSNPAVRDRINSVNALLSHDKIKINSDKCPETAHALETQGYDKKGNPEKFTDHPAIDDRTDCLGYLIHGRWAVSGGAALKSSGYY